MKRDCAMNFKAGKAQGKEPMRFFDVFVGWLTGVLMGAVIFILATGVSGCVYRGAKVTEGTDLAIGISVPGTDGAIALDLLNYLSGFRLGVAENARLFVEYSTSETNSYFGCVTTRSAKRVKARVTPCEVTSGAVVDEQPSADCKSPHDDVQN